ncbi:hypothetical protein KC352_g224 [Hortaea werneckii]|nr:hypothetical protein KC358_g10094 [Hortaea werneckii]KAI6943411.1 hypothetical protein KC341_g1518 [Hortaea werneckii]KAI6951037.1 hypothetical protein KC348_g322 [Hortaea werneckii]KAI6982926.1 hypothetical protein KC321_g371 [Hortaea werneckii]KAI7000227.1 hypothetical protein KC329_g498 [Hortaea werneckii]
MKICYGEVSQLRNSPDKCRDREGRPIEHSKRACGECWEVHLSNEVEEKPTENIECLFCYTKLSEAQIKRFAWAGTYRRYKWKTEDRHFQRCQDRCAASRILDKDGEPVRDYSVEGDPYMYKLQEHDRDTDGNLFACEDCGFETCVDCDRPKHDGEPCSALQTRVDLLQPLPEVHESVNGRAVGVCPSCNSYFIVERGCGYTKCDACKHRFCESCMLPWVGEGGGYLLGPTAHGYRRDGKECLYRSRECPSTHTIKNRFVGQQEAFDARKERREQKRLEKTAKAKEGNGDGKRFGGDEFDLRSGPKQQAKGRKRRVDTSLQDAGNAKQSKKSKA